MDASGQMNIAGVRLLDAPARIDRVYSYFIPPELRDKVKLGSFVHAPFSRANREQPAVVTSLSAVDEPVTGLKPLRGVREEFPAALSPGMMALCAYLVEQTFCSYGEAVRCLLPAGALYGVEDYYSLTEEGKREEAREGCNEKALLLCDWLRQTGTAAGSLLKKKFGEEISPVLRQLAEQGIHVLDTHYSFGFRSVVTNLDVTKPEDLNGHVLRATSSALFSKTLECLGATANPMSFTECLQAIQSGVVEGFEGSVSTLSGAGNPYELVKKVASTNHLIATRWLFISEDAWNQIPEKYQKIIEECAYECGMWEQTSCEDDEATQIEFLKSQGVTWNDVDLDAFGAAMVPVIDWIVDEYGSTYEAYDQLVALVAEFRAKNA